jgi:hypothetical protein
MSYTKVGPFNNDAPPYLNAGNLNTLEDGVRLGAAPRAGYPSGFLISYPAGVSSNDTIGTSIGLIAIPVLARATITQIMVWCNTAQTDNLLRLGLYKGHPTTGQPSTLVVDAGTVNADTTGRKVITLSTPVELEPGIYFGAAVNQGASTGARWDGCNHNSTPTAWGPRDPNTREPRVGWTAAGGPHSGALPATITVSTVNSWNHAFVGVTAQ